MTPGVIDILETIEVDHSKSKAATGRRGRRADDLEEASSVQEPAESIMGSFVVRDRRIALKTANDGNTRHDDGNQEDDEQGRG